MMHLISAFFRILRQFDWLLVLAVCVLASIGLATIYSVDLSRGDTLTFFPTQLRSVLIGLGVLFVAGSFHITFYKHAAKFFYMGALGLLVAVLFFGTTVSGTTGWFRVLGFSFQPAEFAKIGFILFIAWLIERYGRRFDRFPFVIASGFFVGLLMFLILLQPDLGSALVFLGIWFGLLFLTKTKKRFIALVAVLAVIASCFGWFYGLQEYQKARLVTFLDPAGDPFDTGYNLNQSIIAVGAGQVLGRGLGFGSQSQLHFLPEAQTDFIFSVIAEELGFFGVFVVLGLFFFLLWRLVSTVQLCRSDFAAYTVLGMSLLFLVQLMTNVGGTVGLLPITGVTLPFVSYGGSSFIMNCFLIGIAQSIRQAAADARPPELI